MERQGDSPHDHAFVELPVPSMLSGSDLQVLIRETEEKLKLNAYSIEQNLCELQTRIGEACGGEKLPSPTECLMCFRQSNVRLLKPVSTDHHELLDFLKTLKNFLKTEEAYRESVLQLLINISSQCGVAFPTAVPLSEHSQTSMAPFCSVNDDIALDIQETWDDIRLLLRRHLVDKISTDSFRVPESTVFLVQQLCFLYTKTEALEKYKALRSKMVLELLRKKQPCCPCDGEHGFKRMAVDFQTVSPAFYAKLAEDIHILNSIVEPHCILNFVNQAYLQPLAQELGLLMEKELEVLMKDNSTQGGKGMRSSCKKATVAPQDAPQASGNICLTSEQLRGLVQLANTMLQLERQVEDLATELGFLGCSRESCGVKGNPNKVKADVEMSALHDKVTAEMLLQNTEVACLEFEWRSAFRILVPPIVHGVKMFLEDFCSRRLQQEERTNSSTSSPIPLTRVSLRHEAELCLESDRPKMIAKFCADVLEELDALLPLAVVCKDDALLHVSSCYVEVCGRVSSDLLTRLEERAREVPQLAPLKNLPTILASSTYIYHRLAHYESQLGDTNRMPLTLLPVQRSQEVTQAVHEQLTSYSVHVCATSILQDAESHYWADDKPFYEGERCSFSIQMWHYFLSALRSDLWSTASPLLAQQTLAQVLAQTLELLLQRYSRARPSYKRHPQIRLDITAILLCVEQLLWSVYGSVEELKPELTSQTPGNWVSIIHSLCNQLLNVLVILSAPLPEISRTLQNGFSEDSSNIPHDTPFWLSLINPTLFPLDLLRGEVESENSALWLLNIVSSGPDFSPALILQAILHHDCVLLRLLISHSYLCLDSKVDVSPEAQEAAAFVEAIFTVLSSLNNVPRALTRVLQGYLDRRHLWDHFCSLADLDKIEPVLFKCVRDVIYKPISRLLKYLVNMMQACEDRPSPLLRQILPESVLAKIPKEWNYIPQEAKPKDSSKTPSNLTVQALSFIFTHLPSCVASIPLPVRFLFHTAEKHQCQSSRQLRPTALLIRGLLDLLCQALENGETLELVSTEPLDRGVKERLALLSECLQVSLGLEKGKPKTITHKILQALEEKRPKWSSMQLQKAHKLCRDSTFEHVECGLVQDRGGPSEPAEQKMSAVLLELCQGAGGIQNLQPIHHTIQLNESLLRSKIATAADSTSPPEGQPSVLFSSAANTLNTPPHFNPLFHFDHVGYVKFDQTAMSTRQWDWTQLLLVYYRASQVTFTNLLANRWEMQVGAQLEEEEKSLVDHLKKTYLNGAPESCSDVSE